MNIFIQLFTDFFSQTPLNGMMPIDFFVFMSNELGVTTYNVAAILGITAIKSLSLKVIVSVVTALVIAFSGIIGCNFLYNNSMISEDPKIQNSSMPNGQTPSLSNEKSTSTQNIASTSMPRVQSANNPQPVTVTDNNIQSTSVPKVNLITQPVSSVQQGNQILPVVNTQEQFTYSSTIIPTTIPFFTSPINNNHQELVPTKISTYQSTSNDTSTEPTTGMYGDLSQNDINYISTLLAYGSHFLSDNYLNLSDLGVTTILNSCDDVINNFRISEDLFPTKNVWDDNGTRYLQVSENDLK